MIVKTKAAQVMIIVFGEMKSIIRSRDSLNGKEVMALGIATALHYHQLAGLYSNGSNIHIVSHL